ncbi:hypothetical protein SAMN05421644_13329 [Allochromatium warmingii]|uniref:Uncharacterized protein n=1 Tax=Allochromatium warmingii TaxID=61595 RepID=A0A1H3HHJ1_ALLWA|nr:hypothetical protein SAMN05421644_13329 [Allochromatium warmingii]
MRIRAKSILDLLIAEDAINNEFDIQTPPCFIKRIEFPEDEKTKLRDPFFFVAI